MNRMLEVLKRIGRSFRSNLGLKIVALLFAVLLWNYVIIEVNPIFQHTYANVKMQQKPEGLTALKNSGFTLVGDAAQYMRKVNVTVELSRRDSLELNASDLSPWIDVSTISKEGEAAVKVQCISPKGSVVRVEPREIKVKVEKLVQKAVPVECVKTGRLPEGYWLGQTQLSETSLVIQGAASSVDKVARAQVTISLDNLTQEVSVPREFTLLDEAGNPMAPDGIDFVSAPNSIVSLQIYPKKTVPVDVKDSLSGNVASGYEVTDVEVFPTQVEIAGNKAALDAITKINLGMIDVEDAQGSFTIYKALELPNGLHAVSTSGVSVYVKITKKTTQATLSDLPVKVTGLSTGTGAQRVYATVVLTCPELSLKYARASRVHLYADVTGLGVGTHTVPVSAEFDPEIGVTDYTIKPANVLVTITAQ